MRWIVLTGALIGCAEEADELAGEALGPPAFELAVSQMGSGGRARLSAAPVPPGFLVHFALSTSGPGAGPCPRLLGGACLDVLVPTYLGSTTANADGLASLVVGVPAGVRDGTRTWSQAVGMDAAGRVAKSDVEPRVTGPLACPAIWAPVCGYDGVTYGNDCEASAMGMVVAYSGPC